MADERGQLRRALDAVADLVVIVRAVARDGVTAVARDVTEHRRVHRTLTQVVERFEAVEQLTNLGVWTLDLDTDEVWFSAQLRRIFGLAADAVLPNRDELLDLFFGGADRLTIDDAQGRMEAMDGPVSFEVTVRRADGSARDLVVHGEVVVRDGRPVQLWGGARDVTSQRRAERALGSARSQLREQHRHVEVLQSAILPEVPTIEGVHLEAAYVPATGASRVGGDWYDAFVLPDGRVGLVVGDVAGHGLPAVAAMAQLRYALRAQAYASADPAEALAALNHYAVHAAPDVLATVLYGVIDVERAALCWTTAGHLPPVVRTGAATAVLERRGRPPIGVDHDVAFPLHEVDLAPDSVVVLYTDGLVERRDRPIDDGLEVLRAAVDAGPVDTVGERLEELLDTRAPDDDACLLVARLAR